MISERALAKLSPRMAEFGVALVVALICWRLWAAHLSVPAALAFADTGLFIDGARNELFSRALWTAFRPALPCIVFKLCASEPERLRVFFTVTAAIAWSALACAVAQAVSLRARRPFAALAVASLALSSEIACWNDVLLSESLSLSLSALLAAVALMFVARPAPWAAPLAFVALLFALCRDSNAYLLLLLGVAAGLRALWLWLNQKRTSAQRAARPFLPALFAGTVFLLAFAIADASANAEQRWAFSLGNVIVNRVLPDEQRAADFRALGMTANPRLTPGRPRLDYDSDPALRDFQVWLRTRGKLTYIRYLLTHPGYLLAPSWLEARTLFAPHPDRYRAQGFAPAEPQLFELLWQPAAWLARLGASVFLAVVMIRRSRALESTLAIIGLVLLGSAVPHALLIWHGDTMDVPRHALGCSVQLDLALLLLGLALLTLTRAVDPPRVSATARSE